MTVWHSVIQEPKREREPVTESYTQCWTDWRQFGGAWGGRPTIAVNSDYLYGNPFLGLLNSQNQ